MHTHLPTVSKRMDRTVPGAGLVAFDGFDGRVSLPHSILSTIRII